MNTIQLYHVFHICHCGELISHSQGDFDTHKRHGGLTTYPIEIYNKYRELVNRKPDMNVNVLRDLLASYCKRQGIYNNYKQATKRMSDFVFMAYNPVKGYIGS